MINNPLHLLTGPLISQKNIQGLKAQFYQISGFSNSKCLLVSTSLFSGRKNAKIFHPIFSLLGLDVGTCIANSTQGTWTFCMCVCMFCRGPQLPQGSQFKTVITGNWMKIDLINPLGMPICTTKWYVTS